MHFKSESKLEGLGYSKSSIDVMKQFHRSLEVEIKDNGGLRGDIEMRVWSVSVALAGNQRDHESVFYFSQLFGEMLGKPYRDYTPEEGFEHIEDEAAIESIEKPTSGWIYVAKNKSMPGVLKIGVTQSSVSKRMRQLSGSTSCPSPFECVYSEEVGDCYAVEEKCHQILDDLRISGNREFFNVSQSRAIQAISMARGFI